MTSSNEKMPVVDILFVSLFAFAIFIFWIPNYNVGGTCAMFFVIFTAIFLKLFQIKKVLEKSKWLKRRE